MQSSHQREIPTLVNALSSTSPSVNKAISSTRTFTANMKAKNNNASLPTIPALPRNQYGLEDVEDFFNAADRTLVNTQSSSTPEQPNEKGMTIQGVNFSYWQPDVASECSESSAEEEESTPSPVPHKSPITTSSHRTRTPLQWTGAPSQGGILRESTIPPPVGSPVPVESLSPPTDNSPREVADVEADHDVFDFVQDYQSSVSPNSRRASLASIAAAISHARRSSVAPSQSRNRDRRTSTNAAVQTNDELSRNLNRVSFYSRRSSSRGTARPSTGSSLFGRRAGFVGLGRTADGALLCEANGLTFELLVEQGPCPALDVGTQFDPSIREGLDNQVAEQEDKQDNRNSVPILNRAEPVSEGSDESENAEDTNAKVSGSNGTHVDQRASIQSHAIKSKRLSTAANTANGRLSTAPSGTSRRVSIAPEAVAMKEQNGDSTPRRNSRRSSVLPSMKSSKLQRQDPNLDQNESPAGRKSVSLRRASSSKLSTKHRGPDENENFFRAVDVEIIEPDVVITNPEVERRASTRSSRPTMEIFGYATDDDDDDDVDDEPIQTENESSASQPIDEVIEPTAETLKWERVNITAGVDIRPTTTPSANKSSKLSRRACKLSRQSMQAVEKPSETAPKESDTNRRRSTRGRKSIAAVFEEELPEMVADDDVNAADLTLELDTQAMNDPEPERSDSEVKPEADDQDEDEPSMRAADNVETVQLASISYASSLPNTESKTASTLAEKSEKTTNQRTTTSLEQTTDSQHNTEPDIVLDSAPMMELGDLDDDDDNDIEYGFNEDNIAEMPEEPTSVPTEPVDEPEESPEPVSRNKKQTRAKSAPTKKKSTITKSKKTTTTTKRRKATKRTTRNKLNDENFEPKKRVRLSNESELVHQAEVEEETGLRRSKRVRFGRLKYWKNERPIYERRRSQEMPTIAEVELEEKHDPDDKDVQWYTGRR